MKKNIIEIGIPKVKQYMSERNEPLQLRDVAEHLGVTDSTALGVLDLMIAFGIVQKVKRGKAYYFLKDAFNEEQIRAMLPSEKVAKAVRVPKQRGRPIYPKTPPLDERDSFRKEYLADMKERTGSGGGLSALAILRLPQQWANETTTKEPPVEMVLELMGKEMKPKPLINIRPFGTVKHLPKDVRRLSQNEMRHLKNLLKGLGGFEGFERYNTVFSKFSALEHGRYGEVFYLSMGSNPWDNVRKVTVDPSISDYMVLPSIEADRWSSWNDFLTGLKETRRYRKGLYSEMLDEFLESGHQLVEITVTNRNSYYIKHMLKEKIEERNLMNQIETSRVDEWVYLEKVE